MCVLTSTTSVFPPAAAAVVQLTSIDGLKSFVVQAVGECRELDN